MTDGTAMPAIEPLWRDKDGNPLMIRDVVHPDNANESMLLEVVGFEVLPVEGREEPLYLVKCLWPSGDVAGRFEMQHLVLVGGQAV
jgi:hypothetical protein